MDDVRKELVIESRENLDQLDLDIVALERDPSQKDVLARVFRTVHTLKGTCGFFGFAKLERLTHAGETLLGRLRDGDLALNAEMTTALLSFGDAVRSILTEVEALGTDGDLEYAELVAVLDRLQRGENTPAAARAVTPAPTTPAAVVPAAAAPAVVPAPPVAAAAPAAAATAATPEVHVAEHDARPSTAAADASVRVDVALLDSLMNQVGELVLARNQILQYSASHHDPALVQTTQRLNLITTELQERVLKTRMQQIGTIWNKLPRLVRDLAGQLDKDVAIELEGEETELDRTIIEAIKDPLTHIVRNSVDHGIEMPATRIAAGKAAQGKVRIRAFHEGGQVNIEIADDGSGIDREAVKRRAVERGIVTAEQAARMSEREGDPHALRFRRPAHPRRERVRDHARHDRGARDRERRLAAALRGDLDPWSLVGPRRRRDDRRGAARDGRVDVLRAPARMPRERPQRCTARAHEHARRQRQGAVARRLPPLDPDDSHPRADGRVRRGPGVPLRRRTAATVDRRRRDAADGSASVLNLARSANPRTRAHSGSLHEGPTRDPPCTEPPASPFRPSWQR